MRHLLPILPILSLAACVAPAPQAAPPVEIAPQPRPVPPAPAPTSSDWRDWPLTPGNWTYRTLPGGQSEARYGTGAAAGMVLELACDRNLRTVTLSVPGAPTAQPLTIRTSSVTRTVPTVAAAHIAATSLVTHHARLPAADPLLDAMGFSRGRFVVEQPGGRTLVIPAWPEILRVTEDCRG